MKLARSKYGIVQEEINIAADARYIKEMQRQGWLVVEEARPDIKWYEELVFTGWELLPNKAVKKYSKRPRNKLSVFKTEQIAIIKSRALKERQATLPDWKIINALQGIESYDKERYKKVIDGYIAEVNRLETQINQAKNHEEIVAVVESQDFPRL